MAFSSTSGLVMLAEEVDEVCRQTLGRRLDALASEVRLVVGLCERWASIYGLAPNVLKDEVLGVCRSSEAFELRRRRDMDEGTRGSGQPARLCGLGHAT